MNDQVCYVSPNAPFFSMRVTVDGKNHRIKFTNKELRLDAEKDIALIAEIDASIAAHENISSIIHKVDIEAAAALARAHMEQMQSQRGTVKGPVSGEDAKRSAQMAVQERDADLASQGATTIDLEHMRAEMSDSGLELTENAEGVVAPENRDGFTPNTPEETPPDPKSIFANLGKK